MKSPLMSHQLTMEIAARATAPRDATGREVLVRSAYRSSLEELYLFELPRKEHHQALRTAWWFGNMVTLW